MTARLAAVLGFFGLRVAAVLLLLKLSASVLSAHHFAALVQFLAYSAFLGLIAIGGTQSGVIRQVAAGRGDDATGRTHGAALLVWLAALPLLLVPVAAFSGWISTVLLGVPDQRQTIGTLTLLALAAGPGQIWCGMLTGRDRTVASLVAQSAGMLTGTGGAAWFVLRGEIEAAAIAFACGSLVTAGVAFALVRPLRLPRASNRVVLGEAATLLRYSASFVVGSATAAITIFALRSLYRDAFGTTVLSHWMVANRISDLSIQLVGLLVLQLVLPHLSKIDSEEQRRRYILQCGFAGMAAMSLPLILFSSAPQFFVRLFLSEAFLPSIEAIKIYMAGDIIRVWASLAVCTAVAAGAPGRGVAIELAALAIMAAVTVALTASGNAGGPQWGYVTAYATIAAIVLLRQFRKARDHAKALVTADTA